MGTSVLVQKLFCIKIWRLLLIVGLIVGITFVYQCFAFPFGKTFYFSYAGNGSIVVSDANATSLNNSKSIEVYAADLLKGTDSKHNFLEETSGIDEIYWNNTDPKTSMSSSSSEVRNQDGILSDVSPGFFKEGKRKSSVVFVGNVTHSIETQPAEKKNDPWQPDLLTLNGNSTMARLFMSKRGRIKTTTISEMSSLLLQSSLSSRSTKPRRSSVRDRELLAAKLEIKNAPIVRDTPGLSASVFRNVSTFKRSYELMERMLKVYIYREGEKPIFHQPIMSGVYASEGWFMKLMEENKNFVVQNPKKATLFYLPFSSQMLRIMFSEQKSNNNRKDLEKYLSSYLNLIAGKYSFWNRTGGADHFLVACHDWASWITRKNMNSCIRALCNANIGRDFKIGKDTTLPVTYIHSAADPLENVGGKPASERSILAFFAGRLHGYLRPILLHYWENKQSNMKIFGPMRPDIEGERMYREYMMSSKYCICAKGYQVHTPRVVEAIYHECVPVIISDNYVPPFFEVMNWEEFSVFVQEKHVPNLRNILLSIPEEKYVAMQTRVKMVRKHFLWHKEPEKYDIFHMMLHSVWYNRVLQVKTRLRS